MTWFSSLVKIYEENQDLAGKEQNGITLIPISHASQSAQIEVLLGEEGDFLSASVVDKSDSQTLIPVTIQSASRSSGPVHHPLHDKLCYVAGDYHSYVNDEKYSGERFNNYLRDLDTWTKDSYHPSLKAIYRYLFKRSLVKDLVNARVLALDADGKILEKWTGNKTDEKPLLYKVIAGQASDALVRFKVALADGRDQRIWLDQTLQQNWSDYYSQQIEKSGKKDVCFVSGKIEAISKTHPCGIRSSNDRAKIISFNQESGSTFNGVFKGIFEKGHEAVTVSHQASQKAHNALRWLIQKQGRDIHSKTFVAWSHNNLELISVLSDTKEFAGIFGENSLTVFTNEDFSKRLIKAVQGLRCDLERGRDQISIMILGSTMKDDKDKKGRLSIEFYAEISIDDYLAKIQLWHERSAWRHKYIKDKQAKYFYGALRPKWIAQLCYGPNPKDKVVARTVQRIVMAILSGQAVPRDLMELAVKKASQPVAKTNLEWERLLQLACSLYKNYHYERRKYDMALEKNNNQRDYLYGRLLAVADGIESFATYLDDKKKGSDADDRLTNARRMMYQFSQRPMSTWSYLQKKLLPYERRLKKHRAYLKYEKAMMEISDKLTSASYENNQRLSGLYLLGFYHQRSELLKTNKEQEGEKND